MPSPQPTPSTEEKPIPAPQPYPTPSGPGPVSPKPEAPVSVLPSLPEQKPGKKLEIECKVTDIKLDGLNGNGSESKPLGSHQKKLRSHWN